MLTSFKQIIKISVYCFLALDRLTMLGGSICHHSMARPLVADGRDGIQLEVSYEYIE
jgi:hypothetical protein